MSDQLQPKTLAITGATGGMGRACAILAAEHGYNLILTDLNEGRLGSLSDEIKRTGVEVRTYAMDITNPIAVLAFTGQVIAGGGIDAVIHTAGLSPNMAAWEKLLQVDLISSVKLLETLKGSLKPGGCAVAISSMSGHMVPPNPDIDDILASPLAEDSIERLRVLPGEPLSNPGIAYAYAKKALVKYVARQAAAWGREGKRLVSISPGLIDTEMGRLEASVDQSDHKARLSLIALGREGLPREIAAAAMFLISDDASYITGCDLLVDGGFVAAFSAMRRP